MQRTDKNFRQLAMSEDETNAFLEEMFTELCDQGEISSDTDAIPDLRAA